MEENELAAENDEQGGGEGDGSGEMAIEEPGVEKQH